MRRRVLLAATVMATAMSATGSTAGAAGTPTCSDVLDVAVHGHHERGVVGGEYVAEPDDGRLGRSGGAGRQNEQQKQQRCEKGETHNLSPPKGLRVVVPAWAGHEGTKAGKRRRPGRGRVFADEKAAGKERKRVEDKPYWLFWESPLKRG